MTGDEPFSGSGGFFAASETHTAVVLLIGERAYKLKKPVNLGFLDFTTLDGRRYACHREVELNRRIAPDVYLGVADVVGPDQMVCEHVVVMRRMPAARRLSTLVRAGVAVDDQLRQVARQLAVFHSTAPTSPAISAEGSRDAIRRRWTDSFGQLRALRGRVLDDQIADEIETLTYDFLAGREKLFDDRMAAGRVVDGHGDLLADDIYCLDDGPRILDCIEFDDKLRWVDGLDDAAFLAMDLEHLGVPALGTRFLDWYAEFAADPAPTPLRHHFIAYRAFVRAKVACLRHEQGDVSAQDDAARHATLTLTQLRAGAVTLILVGGLPGTGKSTLGAALADRLGAVIISSDRVRKELAGVAPESTGSGPYQAGIYREEWTERTYREMSARAEVLLERGESVVLDASFGRARYRQLARDLAERTHSGLVELRCEAPASVTAQRLRGRTHTVSDADEAIAAAMAADAEAWPEAVTIRTDEAGDGVLARALALVRPGSSAR